MDAAFHSLVRSGFDACGTCKVTTESEYSFACAKSHSEVAGMFAKDSGALENRFDHETNASHRCTATTKTRQSGCGRFVLSRRDTLISCLYRFLPLIWQPELSHANSRSCNPACRPFALLFGRSANNRPDSVATGDRGTDQGGSGHAVSQYRLAHRAACQ